MESPQLRHRAPAYHQDHGNLPASTAAVRRTAHCFDHGMKQCNEDKGQQQQWSAKDQNQPQCPESELLHLKAVILKGLRNQSDAKEVPARFLYDKKGSELYEAITRLEEYYPFKAENELLDEHVENLVSHIPEGSVVVELGCGSAIKTAKLLNAVIARQGRCRFVGIDVSSSILDEALCNLMLLVEGLLSVDMVQGDYLDCLRQVRANYPNDLLCLLWLGSSVGNLRANEAISFFKDVLHVVDYRCRFFVATDMWKKEATLYSAYRDREGVTEQFIKNGMRHALKILGYPTTLEEENSWIYEVEINRKLRYVEMYLKFPQGLNLQHSVNIRPGERVLMEISRKFTVEDIQYLAQESGFHVVAAWRNEKYGSQMLLSDLEALTQCWQETDSLFLGLPDWTIQPIDLRHPFCFYYGHVSSFMKLKILPEESESELDTMFSRGIDPGVLNPSQCHKHPEIPAEWPKKEEIVAYVRATRQKVLQSLAANKNVEKCRLLSFILEHERMHQETLIYMMAQQRKATFERNMARSWQSNGHISSSRAEEPPTGTSILNFLSKSKMIAIDPEEVALGADTTKSGFLWDNEYPQFRTEVKSFFVSRSPISIGEFCRFVLEGGYEKPTLWDVEDLKYIKEKGFKFPASWSRVGDEFYVHEFQATHHWSKVAYKPVYVSFSEAQAFCRWVGARIMTEAEYQRILDMDKYEKTVEQMRSGGWEWTSSPFLPFPGFKAMPEYPEYSTDFFDGNHYVLKGSSPVTHPSMLRDSFRNFYQKLYPYVFAKFRCCKS